MEKKHSQHFNINFYHLTKKFDRKNFHLIDKVYNKIATRKVFGNMRFYVVEVLCS